jgi:hypothetical protein
VLRQNADTDLSSYDAIAKKMMIAAWRHWTLRNRLSDRISATTGESVDEMALQS